MNAFFDDPVHQVALWVIVISHAVIAVCHADAPIRSRRSGRH